MSSNKNTIKDSQGDTPAWVELYNGGGSAVNLGGGYSLSEQGDGGSGWAFPAGTTLSPGQYLIVFLSKRNSSGGGARDLSPCLASLAEESAAAHGDLTSEALALRCAPRYRSQRAARQLWAGLRGHLHRPV